jgi:polyphosphate kinase
VRDADIEIQELEADDLLETMQQNIRKRKFGSVVQVAIYESMPENIRELLVDNLEVSRNDLYVLDSPLGLSGLWQLTTTWNGTSERCAISRVPSFKIHNRFEYPRQKRKYFAHHPYDSFNPVVDLLNAAARDPHVLAIKQTLYRVGSNAPVVEALLEAAERGKQVAVLVELKAASKNRIFAGRALKRWGARGLGLVG